MNNKENYPAFPVENGAAWGGMSIKDYFAAYAMAGALANAWAAERFGSEPQSAAKSAYDYAEAMIEEGKKRNLPKG